MRKREDREGYGDKDGEREKERHTDKESEKKNERKKCVITNKNTHINA